MSNPNGSVTEKLFTPKDIALAKEIESKFPEFKQIHSNWIKYNDGLVKFLKDTGVISAAQAHEFTKHGDYMPFYRQLGGDDTVGPKVFAALEGVKAPRKIKGGEAPLGDFIENVVRNT